MKIILQILAKVILVIIITALIQTAFSLQIESFKYPDQMGNEYGIPIIFGVILIIVAGILTYYLSSKIIKTSKSRLIISIIVVSCTLIFYFVEFKELTVQAGNGDNIILSADQSATDYNYDEKLMSFKSPYKLNEQSLSDGKFNNKTYKSKDFALFYIEMDAHNAPDEAEAIEKYSNLILPKVFFVQASKQLGIQVNKDDIIDEKVSDNLYHLTYKSNDGIESTMYFTYKNSFFTTLQIFNNQKTESKELAQNAFNSVVIKNFE